MFVFGTVFTMLGAIMPLMLQSRNINIAEAGSLFFFLNLGSFAAVLIAGPLVDRNGYKTTLLVSPLLIGFSFTVLALAQSYVSLTVACILLGFGGGALNNATNSLISDLHPEDRTVALNRLGMFFSIGALFIPFLMGSLLAVLGMKGVLFSATAIAVLAAAAFLFLKFPSAKQRDQLPVGSMLKMLSHPLVLIMGLLLFFQSGTEYSSSGWISTLFTRGRGLDNRQASWVLALFWGAVMVARLGVGFWLKRVPEIRFMFFSAFTAALAWLLMLYSKTLVVQVAGVFLLGYALAGIFPTALSIMGARFSQNSGAVFGALFACSTLGGMSVPATIGQIALRRGIVTAISILPLCSAAVGILSRIAAQQPGKSKRQVDRM
jgi:fucose permease